MSSSGSSSSSEFETVFLKDDVSSISSEDPLVEEWSSLLLQVPPRSPKVVLFEQGLYDPGSGEVCAKYLSLSDSSVFRHPYYKYPRVQDPGIHEALFEKQQMPCYALDGQELYLALCKEMNIAPVRKFHRCLLDKVIDLRYYCVNPVGVRAMYLALTYNTTVRRLDLTSSFLNEDACYHLGQLVHKSITLNELVLSGCRIGSVGLRNLVFDFRKTKLDALDLSKNQIGDDGLPFLTSKMATNAFFVKRLNLSYNELALKSAMDLAFTLQYNNNCTHLDLSWNKLFPPKGANVLLSELGNSKVLTELNLSWNNLIISTAVARVLNVPALTLLDLSNNRLGTDAAKTIARCLRSAKKLQTLNLSFNPLSPMDAFLILKKMKLKAVKLKNLLMENIDVTEESVVVLEDIKSHKADTTITYGRIIRKPSLGLAGLPDMREVVMKRLCFLAQKAPKKTRTHIAIYFLQKLKQMDKLQPRDMLAEMKTNKVPIDEDLITQLSNSFPGPRIAKGVRFIDLISVVDYVKRCWPDVEAPPTPPPNPSEAKGKGKKEAGKKKK